MEVLDASIQASYFYDPASPRTIEAWERTRKELEAYIKFTNLIVSAGKDGRDMDSPEFEEELSAVLQDHDNNISPAPNWNEIPQFIQTCQAYLTFLLDFKFMRGKISERPKIGALMRELNIIYWATKIITNYSQISAELDLKVRNHIHYLAETYHLENGHFAKNDLGEHEMRALYMEFEEELSAVLQDYANRIMHAPKRNEIP